MNFVVYVAVSPNKAGVEAIARRFVSMKEARRYAETVVSKGFVFWMKTEPPRVGVHILNVTHVEIDTEETHDGLCKA